jgi:hypothetical protein
LRVWGVGVAETLQSGVAGDGGRIGPMRVASEAMRMLAEAAPRMLSLWVVWTFGAVFLQLLGHWLGAPRTGGALAQAVGIAVQVLAAAWGAGFMALTARRLLGLEMWKFDEGSARFVGLLVAADLVFAVILNLLPKNPEAGPLMMLSMALLLGMILFYWVSQRLALWPLACLVGNREITPRRSFELMDGRVWALVFTSLIVGGVPAIIYTTLTLAKLAPVKGAHLAAAFNCCIYLFSTAGAVAVYKASVGTPTRT